MFIVAGDWNNDGTSDMASLDAESNSLSVFLGIGNGAFGPRQEVPIASVQPTGFAAAKVDEDATLDFLVLNRTIGTVSVFEGAGDGTFPTRVEYPAGPLTSRMFVAEIDGTGGPDVVVAGSTATTSGFSTLLGNGNGGFASPVWAGVVHGSQAFTAADFDDDGLTDLAVATGVIPGIAVHPGNGAGNGTYGARRTYGPVGTGDFATGDLNEDGNLDIVTVSSAGLSTAWGASDASFTVTTPISASVVGVAIGDLDRDGHLDLIGATVSTMTVWHGQGDGSFGAGIVVSGCSSFGVETADLNGDGWLDLVTKKCHPFGIGVRLADGVGGFLPTQNYEFATNPIEGNPTFGDLNEDGELEVVVSHQGRYTILWSTGGGPYTTETVTLPAVSDVRIGNVNADSHLDLVYSDATSLRVQLGNGAGVFTAAFLTPIPIVGGNSLDVADLDGDTVLDVVIPNRAGASILYGEGDGTFRFSESIGATISSVAIIHDFDGNAKPDVAVLGRDAVGAPRFIWMLLQEPSTTVDVGNAPRSRGELFLSPPVLHRDGTIELRYWLGAAADPVSIVIHDVRGRLLHRVDPGQQRAGFHRSTWNGRDLHGHRVSPGVYFASVNSGNARAVRKVPLLRP